MIQKIKISLTEQSYIQAKIVLQKVVIKMLGIINVINPNVTML